MAKDRFTQFYKNTVGTLKKGLVTGKICKLNLENSK